MWLHCEKELGREPEGVPWEASWPCGEALRSLWELNEQCLELLAEQSASAGGAAAPLLHELADLWSRLDESDRTRASRCPFLLLDAGFATGHWARPGAPQIAEREAVPERHAGRARTAGREQDAVRGHDGARERPFFTVPRVNAVAQQIYSTAWYLTRTHPVGVALFLGMSAQCANIVRESTMRQIAQLAEREGPWLRPRWSSAPHLWRNLLEAARGQDAPALDRARLQGVQLLAAELRAVERMPRERTESLPHRFHYVK